MDTHPLLSSVILLAGLVLGIALRVALERLLTAASHERRASAGRTWSGEVALALVLGAATGLTSTTEVARALGAGMTACLGTCAAYAFLGARETDRRPVVAALGHGAVCLGTEMIGLVAAAGLQQQGAWT